MKLNWSRLKTKLSIRQIRITARAMKASIGILIGLLFSIFMADRLVSWTTYKNIYEETRQLPDYDVALVLGTSKYLGKILNDYYTNRIEAAIELYQSEKVDAFLLSGDNAHRSYNEPWTMKRDLLKAGIPEKAIHLDYAGFRTLDSIVRSKEIFGADEFIIVTQKFHCERALFIASHFDIQAVCLAVPGPKQHSGISIRIREVFARVKAVLDLYIFHTMPKFLGPKAPIKPNYLQSGNYQLAHPE
ncbi:YdcF family protein [Vibrio sp. JC009]|uniref:SanA/YdcF family protein n=1 Tax=Vibrio sp. JC009 TaxID=2912314 RepID=UPI0023B0AACF|nr:ElyC/SanA/YdcF family protein [Vibrio sp. JC009]WED23033.1 YdcF family protein [Vibrio sp. JC009]